MSKGNLARVELSFFGTDDVAPQRVETVVTAAAPVGMGRAELEFHPKGSPQAEAYR
jgi:hypothetical protein